MTFNPLFRVFLFIPMALLLFYTRKFFNVRHSITTKTQFRFFNADKKSPAGWILNWRGDLFNYTRTQKTTVIFSSSDPTPTTFDPANGWNEYDNRLRDYKCSKYVYKDAAYTSFPFGKLLFFWWWLPPAADLPVNTLWVFQLPKIPESDQSMMLLIPKTKCQRFQAGQQCDRFYLLKHKIFFITFFQKIVGNARTQVVNMMKSNVARKPLQNLRQFQKRTPL